LRRSVSFDASDLDQDFRDNFSAEFRAGDLRLQEKSKRLRWDDDKIYCSRYAPLNIVCLADLSDETHPSDKSFRPRSFSHGMVLQSNEDVARRMYSSSGVFNINMSL
jgi:hypothetical protein